MEANSENKHLNENNYNLDSKEELIKEIEVIFILICKGNN